MLDKGIDMFQNTTREEADVCQQKTMSAGAFVTVISNQQRRGRGICIIIGTIIL